MDGWVLFVVHESSRCEIQRCLFYALWSRCSLEEVGKKALCVDCSMTNQREHNTYQYTDDIGYTGIS